MNEEYAIYICTICMDSGGAIKSPCRLQIFDNFTMPEACPYGDDNEAEWTEEFDGQPMPSTHQKELNNLPEGYFKQPASEKFQP